MGRVAYPSVAEIPDGIWRWPHVHPAREWACKGSGQVVIVPDFLDRFEALRTKVGFPLPITSGYRSPAHNQAVSTTGGDGPHTTGQAVDIRVSGLQAMVVIGAALQLGFVGIGVSQKGPVAGRFVHLDTARAAPAIWSY